MENKDLGYYMSLPYRIELVPAEDGTGFAVTIPDLKGCISFGETVEGAYEMIAEAKQLWIETALDKGWPVPEPQVEAPKTYSGRFNVRLPIYLHRELAELAEAEGTSLNQLVVALLAEGVERRRQQRRLAEMPVTEAATLPPPV
jgi:antitoxin HicB